MPTYQYRCTECGHDLEAVQKFTDSALTECPNCGGQLRKVFNAVGVVFKGSGFYRTDSRGPEKNGGGDAPKKSEGKESASPEKSGSGDKTGAAAKPGATEKSGAGTGSSAGKDKAPAASGSGSSSSSSTAASSGS